MDTAGNPLFELQQVLYESSNYTRRRLHRIRHDWICSSLVQYAERAPLPRAIEYGPGSGIYLPALARHFPDTVAADVEPAYLAGVEPMAKQLPGLTLISDDITRSRLPDASFGLALCSEVLEHVGSPESALSNLFRILSPGGIALITTPQRYSLMELSCKVAFLPGVIQAVRLIYREPVLPTGHISLRTKKAVAAAIADCGFRVLDCATFGLYVPLVAEFGGDMGGRLIAAFEEHVKGGSLDWLLWTQAYVLQRPAR